MWHMNCDDVCVQSEVGAWWRLSLKTFKYLLNRMLMGEEVRYKALGNWLLLPPKDLTCFRPCDWTKEEVLSALNAINQGKTPGNEIANPAT